MNNQQIQINIRKNDQITMVNLDLSIFTIIYSKSVGSSVEIIT